MLFQGFAGGRSYEKRNYFINKFTRFVFGCWAVYRFSTANLMSLCGYLLAPPLGKKNFLDTVPDEGAS
jgi:hypothetical protein